MPESVSVVADREALLEQYRSLRLPRAVEDKMLRLIRQNRLSKWFSGYGQEAIAVGCALPLRDDDWILPMHRNLGLWTTRGIPIRPLLCQLMGREGGYTNGRDRTFHFGSPEHHIVGMISHLAAMLPVACGLSFGEKLNKKDSVAMAFVGEGATREGDFHEAMNLAAVWKLPVIFVVENNQYGLSTPTREAMSVRDIADAAFGYGMQGEIVDGNDLHAVVNAVEIAVERAREGQRPTLLEMKTFRMRGHEEASGTKYVPKALMEKWAERDPIKRFRKSILEAIGEDELAAIDRELTDQVEKDVEWALTQPPVESTWEKESAAVFAVADPQPSSNGAQPITRTMRFVDAVQDGLREAMRADDRTIIMGQDIAEYGGVFKVTEGFLEEFGKDRVRNTPIIESGAVGAAMGLALTSWKPILEIQYADFITCGFNQIVNNLGTTHYRWNTPLNVTIRAPFGGGIGAGPFHSQSPEAWFTHTPGLKVVIPGTPRDAKGLMISAINDPNPVLVFEHKFLYRTLKGEVPEGLSAVPLGVADIVKSGDELTIVTYGIGRSWALEEAEAWSSKGIEIEVIDLRTLIPWDREAVLKSLKKTGRLLVLHEAQRTGGFGGEIAAEITEEGFEFLDAPPIRVASADWPIAFSKSIESDLYSAKARLHAAVERVLRY